MQSLTIDWQCVCVLARVLRRVIRGAFEDLHLQPVLPVCTPRLIETIMSLTKGSNRPPNNTEIAKLNRWIAQEEAILASIQKLEGEREKERMQLLNKSALLRRTLQSTKVIQDVASQMFSNNERLLKGLVKEVATQEAEISAISEYFPSTRDFVKELKEIELLGKCLQSALEKQLKCIGGRVNSVDEELGSTVDLEAYILDTASSTSVMVSTAENAIQKKRRGLHPIRRLPTELLEGIFQECVHEESRGWLNDPSKTPDLPKAATTVASVCRFWRGVALQCPHLWRCLRAPIEIQKCPHSYMKVTTAAGLDHFRNFLRLRGDLAIELTMPPKVSIPDDIDMMSIPIDRLNILNATNQWPATFSSPFHLWVGPPANFFTFTIAIPSSLLLRTKTITALNVCPTFGAPNHSVNHLILSGQQLIVPFIPILTSLPNLEEFDVQIWPSPAIVHRSSQALIHSKLRCIRLHSSCFSALERSLSDGLQLPQLRSLTLFNLTTSFNFPFISAQFGSTVTSLHIHGTETKDPCAIRSVVDKFHRINTLSLSGTAVGTTLHALYEVSTTPIAGNPKEKTSGDGEIQGIREMPKGLEKIVIQDYGEDGSTIQKHLRMMRSNPAADTQPIKVIFDGCPNIRKEIREEFTTARPTGSHCDPYVASGSVLHP